MPKKIPTSLQDMLAQRRAQGDQRNRRLADPNLQGPTTLEEHAPSAAARPYSIGGVSLQAPQGRLRAPPTPVRVVIFTYNRPADLLRLLGDIVHASGRHAPSVVVYDDASTSDYSGVRSFLQSQGWEYRCASERHGKKGFARWVGRAYSEQASRPEKVFVSLADDHRLCHGFFDRALSVWRSLPKGNTASLTLQRESGRAGKPCWTGVKPRAVSPHAEITGWVDGCFIAGRKYFEALGWGVPGEVPPTRWDRNPYLGSGVGQLISNHLHDNGLRMYGVRNSLTAHVGQDSEMNPEERRRNPMYSLQFVGGDGLYKAFRERTKVTASMASIPSRAHLLPRVVRSLLFQVDELCVYLNGYDRVPPCLKDNRIKVARSGIDGPDLGDAGKFYWVNDTKGYVLTVDDDIVYPANYVRRYLQEIERLRRRAVVGVHGVVLPSKPRAYYTDRTVFHCRRSQSGHQPVHLLGTGTTAFHSDTIKVRIEDFQHPNMADIWLGIVAKRQKVPMVCLEHDEGWLRCLSSDPGKSIYERYVGKDRVQTRAVQGASPWTTPLPIPR